MPAVTAASPMISTPTMPTVDPTGVGSRSSASRNKSYNMSMRNISNTLGSGTPSLALTRVSNSLLGIIS